MSKNKISVVTTTQYGDVTVEGYVEGLSWSAISFTRRNGSWTTGSSTCIPGNIEKARLYIECYNQTIAKVQEIIDGGLV